MTVVRLEWTDPNSNEDGVYIYRDTVPLDTANPENLPAPIDTLPPNTTLWDDTNAAPGATYYYAVAYYKGTFVNAADALEVTVTAGVDQNGLVFHYTFDTVSGSTVVDETGNFDGTLNGGTATTVNGENGYVFASGGAYEHVSIPVLGLSGAYERTVTIRGNSGVFSGSGVIYLFAFGDASGSGTAFQAACDYADEGGRLQLQVAGGNRTFDHVMTQTGLDTISFVLPAGATLLTEVLCYVNGQPVPEYALGGDVALNTADTIAEIGAPFENLGTASGDKVIVEALLHSRGFSAQEIGNLHNYLAS